MSVQIEIREMKPQKILEIRGSCAFNPQAIGQEYGRLIGGLFQGVQQQGGVPKSPPMAVYYRCEGNECDLSAAVAVETAGRKEGGVIPGELPGGPAARLLHKGPYDKLHESYDALMRWMKEQRKAPAGPSWEVYLNDPGEVRPEEILTEIYMPVRDVG